MTLLPPHVAQLLLWIILGASVLLWALGRIQHAGGAICRAILSPILTDRKTELSLGRTLLVYWLGVQGWFILRHPQFFMAIQWPAALILIFSDLFLLAYCFGSKPWMRGLAETVAGRLSIGGAAGMITTAASVVTQQPAAPAPEIGPAPVPEKPDLAEHAG